MTLLSRSILLSNANTTLPDNTDQEISPEDVRTNVKNIIDSMVSKNGDEGILGELQYSSTFTLSDGRDLTHKKYVDDLVDAVTIDFADLTGDPYDNAALAAALDEYIKLDGSTPWTGDQDVNGNDLIGIATILLDGDMTFDLAGDKILFVDGSSDLFTIEKATAFGNGANITWKLNDSADNSQGALVFEKATVGVSGIFSGLSSAADLVFFSGMGYDPSSGDPAGRMYIGSDGHIFYGALSLVSSPPSIPTVSHYFRGYDVGSIATFTNLAQDTKFIINDGGDAIIQDGSKAFYIGDTSTNGSWRMRISGTDLHFERRESGTWVSKGSFAA